MHNTPCTTACNTPCNTACNTPCNTACNTFSSLTTRLCAVLALFTLLCGSARGQERVVQNRPYIDTRMSHFGIHFGIHLQDLELENTGPQQVTLDDGTQQTQTILTEVDNWNPGFSVGVMANIRISDHFALRVTPSMHFGQKHLRFRNLSERDDKGREVTLSQDLKSTYVALPIDLKFGAERYNNYRPYIFAGVTPMYNLSGTKEDPIQLSRNNLMVNIGLGCDLYMPFFKLIPELRFCYGLGDVLDGDHWKSLQDKNKRKYSTSVRRATSKMIILTFYFE